MTERRSNNRISHRTPIRFFVDGDREADYFLESADVCQGGLFVETELLPDLGDVLEFELSWGGQPLSGYGRVVRVDSQTRPGFGMAFEAIAPG